MESKYHILAFVVALMLLFPLSVVAADGYVVTGSGGNTDITEHAVCQSVTNNKTDDIFVPTKSAPEWLSFRTNTPADVALAACPPVCGGVEVGGYCWYYGTTNQGCDDVCLARGGWDSDGTINYVGSGGTDINCGNVMDALSVPGSGPATNFAFSQMGCGYETGAGTRIRWSVAPTLETASGSSARRVCACND